MSHRLAEVISRLDNRLLHLLRQLLLRRLLLLLLLSLASVGPHRLKKLKHHVHGSGLGRIAVLLLLLLLEHLSSRGLLLGRLLQELLLLLLLLLNWLLLLLGCKNLLLGLL